MAKIKLIEAREILDSRGNPTVETKIILDDDCCVKASVPSGASLGKYEALELRDGDEKRFNGMGVTKAVANVNQVIAPAMIDKNPVDQRQLDQMMINLDGTINKSKLGANAILSVSIALCKAGAAVKKIPVYRHLPETFGLEHVTFNIPTPLFNLINGGKHGAGNLNFQEFLVIPRHQLSFSTALRVGEEIYQAVKKYLIRHGAVHSVGDEGGFAPNLFTNADALEVLKTSIEEAGYQLNDKVFLGLDVAASQFFEGNNYHIRDKKLPMSTNEMVNFYQELYSKYQLFLIEDPFHEDDWGGWQKLMKALPELIIVGDDMLATNLERIKKSLNDGACNGVVVKPNQIGTVSEAVEVLKFTKDKNMKAVVAHRSGETNDDFIADFAVGLGSAFIKFGAPARGERVAKYNRLLEIEKELSQNS